MITAEPKRSVANVLILANKMKCFSKSQRLDLIVAIKMLLIQELTVFTCFLHNFLNFLKSGLRVGYSNYLK